VLAAGSWTSLIGQSIDSSIDGGATANIPIEPIRGQMLCFESRPQLVRHVIYSSRGYLVPRRDGRLLAGSTAERAGFDKSVTAGGVDSIKSVAFEISPAVASLRMVDAWAGFRPRAPDDLPVIGPDDAVAGLFYATGHYRNGILLAPITAELIADVIVNKVIPPLVTEFLPARFRV
jgi:glycine oxidase